jgi:hypothetical protein
MFDFSNYPAGCKAVYGGNTSLKSSQKFLQKSLATGARWVRFALPNENWALRRVLAM